MISIAEVEGIHQTLMKIFGGSYGIRDRSLLDSALAGPFQTFDKVRIVSTLWRPKKESIFLKLQAMDLQSFLLRTLYRFAILILFGNLTV